MILVLSLIVLTCILIGCADKKSGDKGLTIWVERYFSDVANEATEKRINQYASEMGIKVNVEFISAIDYMTKLNASIEAGVVPDVTVGNPYKVLSYFPNNPYLDISDIVYDIDSERKMLDSMINGTKIDGKNYFAPYIGSSSMLFVRKDLLDKHNIPLPTTWDEIFDAAVKISDPANGIYGLGMGSGPTDEDGENTFRMLMWNYGGSLLDANGNIRTTPEPNTVALLTKYRELFEAGAIPPASTTWDPGGNNSSYLLGESAIVLNAPTLWTALQSDENYKEIFENTVILNTPKGTVDDTVVLGLPYGWSIMQDSDNIEEATRFVKYMFADDWYDSYMETVAPVFGPIFADSKDLSIWNDGSVNQKAYEYNAEASGYYGYPATAIEDRALASKHYFLFPFAAMLNSVVTSNITPEDAVMNLYKSLAETESSLD